MKQGLKNIRVVTVVVCLIGLALIYYNYLNNKAGNKDTENTGEAKTDIETLCSYDFEEDYPKTVREVVKLHCRYQKCIYNEVMSDNTIQILNCQMRELYCDDLLANNSESTQLEALKADKKKYEDDSRRLVNYVPDESSQVKYATVDGVDYAEIDVAYNIKIQTTGTTMNQRYMLMKDEDEKWKIVGWADIASKSDTEATTEATKQE